MTRGRRLRALRESHGLTAAQAAELVHARGGYRTVQRWEQEEGKSARACPEAELELLALKLWLRTEHPRIWRAWQARRAVEVDDAEG